MTREQIEAWLILEGWECRQAKGCVPVYRNGNRSAFYNHTVYYKVGYEFGDDYYDMEVIPPDEYNNTELKAIYQEIIKHEKD
jgi:hypothetical protein